MPAELAALPLSLGYPSALDHYGSLCLSPRHDPSNDITKCRAFCNFSPRRSCSRVAIVHQPVRMHVGDGVVLTIDVSAPISLVCSRPKYATHVPLAN